MYAALVATLGRITPSPNIIRGEVRKGENLENLLQYSLVSRLPHALFAVEASSRLLRWYVNILCHSPLC